MLNSKDNNAVVTVAGSKMTIEIDLSKSLGKSSTGKSELIASSRGYNFVDAGDHGSVGISLNVTQK